MEEEQGKVGSEYKGRWAHNFPMELPGQRVGEEVKLGGIKHIFVICSSEINISHIFDNYIFFLLQIVLNLVLK